MDSVGFDKLPIDVKYHIMWAWLEWSLEEWRYHENDEPNLDTLNNTFSLWSSYIHYNECQ